LWWINFNTKFGVLLFISYKNFTLWNDGRCYGMPDKLAGGFLPPAFYVLILVTRLDLRHLVQTYIFLVTPLWLTFTLFILGFCLWLVLLLTCDRPILILLPKLTDLLHISHLDNFLNPFTLNLFKVHSELILIRHRTSSFRNFIWYLFYSLSVCRHNRTSLEIFKKTAGE
jgi:hypothetical protein